MDFQTQMELIRKEKRLKYEAEQAIIDAERRKIVEEGFETQKYAEEQLRLEYLKNKYAHVVELNKIKRSAHKIVRFIRKNYFKNRCINEEQIDSIAPRNRFRINITTRAYVQYTKKELIQKT